VVSLSKERETRMKKYKVTLREQEREEVGELISKGKGAARKLLHARVLLKADGQVGWNDQAISEALVVRSDRY
jgi:hypothetical protein